MMKKNPGVIKRLFFVFQAIILVIAMSLTGLYVSVQYFQQTSQIWLENIDRTAHLALHHIRSKNEIIQSQEDGSYLVYVLNQADGTYAFESPKRSPDGQLVWERYSKKLIYEMQKQKQGWIFYPEKAANPLPGYQQVIRYLPLDDLGWIVAVESVIPMGLARIGNVFDYKFFIFFFLIMFLGVLSLWFLTQNNFDVMRKIIADSVESNLLSLNKDEFFHPQESNQENNLTLPGPSKSSFANLEGSQKTSESPFFEENRTENSGASETPRQFDSPAYEADSLSKKLDLQEKATSPQNFSNQNSSFKQEDVSRSNAGQHSEMDLEQKIRSKETSTEMQGVVINLQNIKSEALKKIISDFRNKK